MANPRGGNGSGGKTRGVDNSWMSRQQSRPSTPLFRSQGQQPIFASTPIFAPVTAPQVPTPQTSVPQTTAPPPSPVFTSASGAVQPAAISTSSNSSAPVTPPVQQKRSIGNEESVKRIVRRKFSDALRIQGEPVKILVGQAEKVFFVHEELLVKHSEFFKSALSKEWNEGKERLVTLAEDDPEQFEIFSGFLYSSQIFRAKEGDLTQPAPPRTVPYDAEWARLCKAWVLGEKLLSTSFKDACTDAVVAKLVKSNNILGLMYTKIYPHGVAQYGIKRLCVDLVVWKWTNNDMANRKDGAAFGEFWYDVALALNKVKLAGRSGTPPFYQEIGCMYHDHGKDQACYKTMF